MPSVVLDIDALLVRVLKGSLALENKLGGRKVYSLAAPSGTNRPYVVIGNITEGKIRTFKKGKIYPGRSIIHIWSIYNGNKEALEIYQILESILDGTPLTITGTPDFISGKLELLKCERDTKDRTATHGVASWETLAA